MNLKAFTKDQLTIHGNPYIEDVFSEGELSEIHKWIRIYDSKLLFFREKEAIKKLKSFDNIYCQRVGISLDQLFEYQVKEAKRMASMKFTAIQNEFNDTMFNYDESDRPAAYKRFEERYLRLKLNEEKKFPFKAFVACDLGLVRRTNLWF